MTELIASPHNTGKVEAGKNAYQEQHEEQFAKDQTKEAQREALRRAPELVRSAKTQLEEMAVSTKAAGIGDLIQLSRPETQRICAELGLSSSQTAYVQDMVEQKLTGVHERTESLKAQKEKEKPQAQPAAPGRSTPSSVDRLFGGGDSQPFMPHKAESSDRFDREPLIKAFGETLASALREQIRLIAPVKDSPLSLTHGMEDRAVVDQSRLQLSPEPGDFLMTYYRHSRYWQRGLDLQKKRAA